MKKSLICTLLLFAGLTAAARVLTPEEALRRVYGENTPMKAPAQALQSRQLLHTVNTASDSPAVYIFGTTGEQGYMVVGADDVAMPLLGYSDTGSLPADGTLPPQMQWWLGQYAAEIERAQTVAAGRWLEPFSSAAIADRAPIAPLCSTQWNQDAPYNNLCPTIAGRKTYTGCVATAMAQVMKYHNWPAKGRESITYRDAGGTARSMNFAVTFGWNDMLDSYAGTTTSAQKNAVALLMKACGYSVQMNYGTSASGASDIYVAPALIKYFDYDAGAHMCERQQYGLAEWQDMIYDNLCDVGPVLYCGSSHLGGHAFVCDGYSTDGYFHFNWGWGGAYDGYYLLTALNPEGEGIGGFAGGYNMGQSVVLGIQKPTGNVSASPVRLTQGGAVTGSIYGGTLTLESTWVNKAAESVKFTLALKLEPSDGTSGTTRYIESPYGELEMGLLYSIGKLQFDATSIPNGTWKATVVMKDAALGNNAKWMSMLHPINVPDYVTVTRNVNNYNVVDAATANLQVTSAQLLTEFYYGCSAKLRFTVTNPNGVEVAQAIAPCLVSGNNIVAAGGCCFIDLMPGETVTRELTFDWAVSSSFKLNTPYECYLYDAESGLVFHDFGSKSVLANPGDPRLSATAFSIVGGTQAVDRSNIVFNASVKCLGGYLAAPLIVAVTDEGGGSFLASANSAEVLFLSSGQTADTEFHLSFPEGEAGKTYSAFLGYLTSKGYEWLRNIDFTLDVTRLDAVSSDDYGMTVAYDKGSGQALVESGHELTFVSVVNAAGAVLHAPASLNGTTGTIDLSHVGAGVVILTVGNSSGAVQTYKLAVR